MRVGLVTNFLSRGLAKDAKMVASLLQSLGHEVNCKQYDHDLQTIEPSDLLIFLETVVEELIPASKAAPWIFVNPEFIYDRDINVIRERFSRVLCKTHEAFRICSELFPEQAVYTGFMAQDRYDKSVKRERKFLHVSGSSRVKGTESVVNGWKWRHNGKEIDAPLIVVSDWFEEENLPALPWVNDHWEQKVSLVKNISDDELKRLQNECMFHLQPSGTEGFGHTLRESLSVNAILVTTGVPPMNEIESAYFVPPVGGYQFHQATIHEVSPLAIHEAAQALLNLKERDFPVWDTRKIFLKGNEEFKQNFTALLENFNPSAPRIVYSAKREWEGQKRVAFIGNFETPESTEEMMKFALEQGLGHEVIPLHERTLSLERLRDLAFQCDCLFWVRTPNWLKIPDDDMYWLLHDLHKKGISTVSLHLDKFWGIPEREALIGKHPFWKTQYCFTADGSRQADFAERGVNHFWMKPAMSEVYLHPGVVREEYKCDVGFVGARGYHSEYPWRAEMLEFLQETYRNRFRLVDNVRGHQLNDVYASFKLVVGDCFAAGTPNYYSDRMVETPGRFGFLLSPEIDGLDIPLMTYQAQRLDDLKCQIDYWLPQTRERRNISRICADYVREHDTWTIRMWQVLSQVFA
jgi:hypothetical protein